MEYFLQILGSIASIGSIPLAIYLYLRSREAKYFRLRQEIVRILSFQVGEGRWLRPFEIQAVIDSKLRENKLRKNAITVYEVVEDLVCETISSPMLDSQRKEEIIRNLREIHHQGAILKAIQSYGITYRGLLHSIQNEVKLRPEDSILLNQESTPLEEAEALTENGKTTEGVSALFGWIAGLASVAGVILSLLQIRGESISNFFSSPRILLDILISLLATIAAMTLTYFFRRTLNKVEGNEDKKMLKGKIDNT